MKAGEIRYIVGAKIKQKTFKQVAKCPTIATIEHKQQTATALRQTLCQRHTSLDVTYLCSCRLPTKA